MTKMDIHSEEYLKTILSRQLRLSMGIASVFVVIIVAIPLLNKFLPEVMNPPFMGFTVSWFLLGYGIFPVLIFLSWLFVRRSNDFEDEAVGMADAASLPGYTGPHCSNKEPEGGSHS
jgi:uncharacterized membrane protein (DUF485 family)